MSSTSDLFIPVVNSICIGLTILSGFVFGYGCFGYESTKTISDRRKTKFTPASFSFVVSWISIYIWAIIWNYRMYVYPSEMTNTLSNIPYIWIGIAIANIGWCFLFACKQFYWSMVSILVYLAFLIMAYIKLGVTYYTLQSSVERYIEFGTFSFHLGWLSVATIVNFFALRVFKPSRQKSAVWTAVGILLIVCAFALYYTRDFIYPIPIIIAFIGIAYERRTDLEYFVYEGKTLRIQECLDQHTIEYDKNCGEHQQETIIDIINESAIPSIMSGVVTGTLLLSGAVIARYVLLM